MNKLKIALCWVLAIFFFAAGILHFVQDDSFAAIVPPILPFPKIIVWITGAIELVLAVGLTLPRYRKAAGMWLAPYLLAVLPANIYMAMNNIPLGEVLVSPLTLWGRVALQFPLIALILWASGNFASHKSST